MTDSHNPLPPFDASGHHTADSQPDAARMITPEHAQSPIRPHEPPNNKHPKPLLVPAKPAADHEDAAPPPQPSDTGESSPDDTLKEIREVLSQVAEEFASGKINRAQFHAIYNRYSEKRRIIEQMLARNPTSQAWQQVARRGHTGFLREHFEARVVFFALFGLGDYTPIVHHGTPPPGAVEVMPVLRKLPYMLQKRGQLGPAKRELEGGRWMVIVPGQYTVSVVFYSLEPARLQVQQIADLHSDFERANVHALARQDIDRNLLVFPQRALFN